MDSIMMSRVFVKWYLEGGILFFFLQYEKNKKKKHKLFMDFIAELSLKIILLLMVSATANKVHTGWGLS